MFEPRLAICSATRAWAPAPTDTMVITAPTPITMPSIVSALRSLLTRSARTAMRAPERTFTPRPLSGPRPPRQLHRVHAGLPRRARRFLSGHARPRPEWRPVSAGRSRGVLHSGHAHHGIMGAPVLRAQVTRRPPLPRAARSRASGAHRRESATGFVLDQPPIAEGQVPRGKAGDIGLVRDEHDGDAGAVQVLEERHDLDARPAVERAGRLVGQDQDRVVDRGRARWPRAVAGRPRAAPGDGRPGRPGPPRRAWPGIAAPAPWPGRRCRAAAARCSRAPTSAGAG